jgi:hypothetical protein
MRSANGLRRAAAAAATAIVVLAGSTALAAPHAKRTDPAFTASLIYMSEALTCHGGLGHATRDPILLVPGTTLDPGINFSWNYERAFNQRHWPWCATTLPNEAMGNIQTAAQYIVYAIQRMHAIAHRKIDILGYSQGGMVPRWSLKYWPSVRGMINDYVGIDPSNHGSLEAAPVCSLKCAPALWQQTVHSRFLTALNSGPETWRGINYTVIYSHADEVVTPNLSAKGSSSLHTGHGAIRNIAVQSICPMDISDHLAMGTYDPIAYALAVDAFTHRGPARPSRIPRSVCTQVFMPGIARSAFASDYATYVTHIATVLSTSRKTAAEPRLAAYAR